MKNLSQIETESAASGVLVAAVLSILVVCAGCSNDMSFTQGNEKPGIALSVDELPGADDPATQAVASTCSEAAAAGRLLSVKEELSFPDPGRTCDWENDGNLERRDQWHQGRIRQDLTVTLPAGATLCHADFEFPTQRFRFDDHFWFLFDDVIVAASLNYSDRFGTTNGLSLFDWSKIAGTFWDSSREGVWCLANADCNWPRTDTEGSIRMSFRNGTYYAVSARDRARAAHQLSFVTVGDDNSTDCQHRPVGFSVTLQYVK